MVPLSEQEQTNEERPLLLLDVDGVICPFGQGATAARADFALVRAGGASVWFSEQIAAAVKRLQEHFELVWASGWEEHANRHILPLLGLDAPLPVISFADIGLSGTWKLRPVVNAVRKRPLAWVDDELGADAHAWAQERERAGIPTLLVDVDCGQGLGRREVELLEAFAARVAERG